MWSVGDDRTARAVIRDEALRLFAARGPDAVRLREGAARAAELAERLDLDPLVLREFRGMVAQAQGFASRKNPRSA